MDILSKRQYNIYLSIYLNQVNVIKHRINLAYLRTEHKQTSTIYIKNNCVIAMSHKYQSVILLYSQHQVINVNIIGNKNNYTRDKTKPISIQFKKELRTNIQVKLLNILTSNELFKNQVYIFFYLKYPVLLSRVRRMY